MTEKRFKVDKGQICDVVYDREKLDVVCRTITVGDDAEHCCNVLNALHEENEQLKQDIENLKITIDARETLIDVCEKKFKELGYIITVDDDGYVIE